MNSQPQSSNIFNVKEDLLNINGENNTDNNVDLLCGFGQFVSAPPPPTQTATTVTKPPSDSMGFDPFGSDSSGAKVI